MVEMGTRDPELEKEAILIRNPGRVWVGEARLRRVEGMLMVTGTLRFVIA